MLPQGTRLICLTCHARVCRPGCKEFCCWGRQWYEVVVFAPDAPPLVRAPPAPGPADRPNLADDELGLEGGLVWTEPLNVRRPGLLAFFGHARRAAS